MIPDDVRALLAQRDDARARKDYARADELRGAIEAAGFVVIDAPEGARLEPKPTYVAVSPGDIDNELSRAPSRGLSFHLLYEGAIADVERFLAGLRAHNDVSQVEVVLVDNGSADGAALQRFADEMTRVVHLSSEHGWAVAVNAGLKTSRAARIAVVDLSIEPVGDIVTPLVRAFEDPTIGLAGPYGLRSADMRDWQPSAGPEVEALEGYLLAARRDLLAQGLIHEKFRWYRNADIDLSFQLRALGSRAVVVELLVVKHAHRGWESLDPEERTKRSKRNHYIFFDRWKNRADLLLGPGGPA